MREFSFDSFEDLPPLPMPFVVLAHSPLDSLEDIRDPLKYPCHHPMSLIQLPELGEVEASEEWFLWKLLFLYF
jgi:hypothetical protein